MVKLHNSKEGLSRENR